MSSLTHLTVLSMYELCSGLRAIGECVGLVSLTINFAHLPVDLPKMLTAQQVALREVTLIQPTFSEEIPESLRWCDAFNRPPALARISILGCRSRAESVDTLILALTKWLRPFGPLRVLALNLLPRTRMPPEAIVSALLAALPLLQRLEWELCEIAPHSSSQVAARVRGTNFDIGTEGQMDRWLRAAHGTGSQLQRMDPRITMVEPQPTLTRIEQESRLRRKYSVQA